MPALNVFLTPSGKADRSFLKQHVNVIGCVTVPYGQDTSGLESFYQAVLLTESISAQELAKTHPQAGVAFSHQAFSCSLPLIQCTAPQDSDADFVCFCLEPPDSHHFIPPGLTEDWFFRVQKALRHRNPETVTVELCAGAYTLPFPYDGSYTTLTVSEALKHARNHGCILNVNKNSYYSYFVYTQNACPHICFFSTVNGISRQLKRFSELGIHRFVLSDTELSDPEMSGLFSLFEKSP